VTLVLSVVKTAIRSVTDAIPAFFSEVLLVVNAISRVPHGIVSSFDASPDPNCKHYRHSRLSCSFVAAILLAVALVAACRSFFLPAVLTVVFAVPAITLPVVTIVLTPIHSFGARPSVLARIMGTAEVGGETLIAA
jgi:hypothetical protein